LGGVSTFLSRPSSPFADFFSFNRFFGLLNIFSRPLGGVIADILYRRFGQAEGRGLVAKKYWMAALAVVGGVLGLLVGLISPNTPTGLVALVSIFAIFIEAGNGATCTYFPLFPWIAVD
jgi:NNP family nitrate/nitrite transporter-like MFS transporter